MRDRVPTFRLEIATPLGKALAADVEHVQLPSVQGELGVLPGHVPLLGALRAGAVRWHVGGKPSLAVAGPGFVEVEHDRVLVLTERFVPAAEIDAESMRQERERAEAELAAYRDDPDAPRLAELRRALEWAEACLAVRAEHDC